MLVVRVMWFLRKFASYVFIAFFMFSIVGCMHSNFVRQTFFKVTKAEGWKNSFPYGNGVYVFKYSKNKLILLPSVLRNKRGQSRIK